MKNNSLSETKRNHLMEEQQFQNPYPDKSLYNSLILRLRKICSNFKIANH
jgi:hypothetical protein